MSQSNVQSHRAHGLAHGAARPLGRKSVTQGFPRCLRRLSGLDNEEQQSVDRACSPLSPADATRAEGRWILN
jgi:hypothetical protein